MKATSSSRKKAGPGDEVRAYLASLSPAARREVQKIRAAIRALAPGAVESPAYGILGYKLEGRPLVYCAGFKEHTSLYPITPAVRKACGEDVGGYAASKGTIRFPLGEPIPLALIRKVIRVRVAEERAKRKA